MDERALNACRTAFADAGPAVTLAKAITRGIMGAILGSSRRRTRR